MSLGALSPEAHRTLATGMNRMGARSNSGEGGEDPESYAPLPNGDRADNRIKQVASARLDRKSTRLNSSQSDLVCRLLLEKKKGRHSLLSTGSQPLLNRHTNPVIHRVLTRQSAKQPTHDHVSPSYRDYYFPPVPHHALHSA